MAGHMKRAWCVVGCLAICAVAASCTPRAAGARSLVRLAGGPRDATFFILANAIASVYTQRLPDVVTQTLETKGTSENLDVMESGEAECGFGSADLVYDAYLRGTARSAQPHGHLRGVAVLFPNVLHVVTRGDSGQVSLADLSGKRLAVAVPGDLGPNRSEPRRDAVTSTIAELSPRHEQPHTHLIGMADAVSELEDRRVDAAIYYGGYPFQPVTEAAQRFSVHFMAFDDLASSLVKAKYPFWKSVVIPAGTYHSQDSAVATVAIDNVLVCRSDLPPDLVYRLTRGLFEGLSSVASVHASARQINPERGASTPIPLHDGATRYYRERELFR